MRVEYPGVVYHVTSRGNAQEAIYLDDEDRELFLGILGQACERFRWAIHAYCLMSNHYHLLLETPDANLARYFGVHYSTVSRAVKEHERKCMWQCKT